MPQLAVSFELGGLDPDRAEAACFAAGALSLTFSDTRDDAVLEPAPGEIRLWPATRLQALFDADQDPRQLQHDLQAALGPLALELHVLQDRPWEREWLRDFHAMRFGSRLWICPNHEQVEQPDAVVVKLDPGLAFGTGTHPSTALCLAWLDANAPVGRQVIDFGCGSGVLAIAAARLGAAQVQAWDIDPQALLATAQNAAANGVDGLVQVCGQESALTPGAGLLIANILANTLCELAPHFVKLLRPGAQLLLAGILDTQAEAVTAAYAPWFDMRLAGRRAEWVALAGNRT
ncbi:MAG TPA: 50S ribosomal protein L11 methyltransferase [Steroidobacteraceae bacterium]|nr:50S ribosomal protein L11 methyltransferase [Steroidobacteraceae bacterium]